MAGSLVLNVEILGEFKKLAEATKGSQKSLSSLDDNAKKISKGINKALGAIGIGFSLAFLVNEFKDSTKAAIEDAKSKALLTKALQDNLKATDQTVDGVEKFISKLQITTSIADDQLRPAFSKLALATKDTDKAMRLMAIATDVAAGTGKGLDAVVQAMSRSLAGSDTALNRLVPSVKGAADPIAELEKMFSGAAKAAADTDPYARLQIIFGEIQEQVGTALLPILNNFSEWLATPEGQEKLQEIVDGVVLMVEEFTKFVGYIADEVMPVIENLTGEKGFEAVAVAVTNIVVAVGVLKTALMFFSAGNPLVAGIILGITAIITIYDKLGSSIDEVIEKQREFRDAFGKGSGVQLGDGPIYAAGGKIGIIGKTDVPVPPKPTGTQVPLGNTVITINNNRATVDGALMVDQINNALKDRGLSVKALK